MSLFSVDAKCQESFVIDKQGITSKHPVNLKTAEWDGKTLTLESNSSANICNSFMSIGGNTFTQFICGSVYINGIRIDQNQYSKNEDAKIFSKTWEELELELVNPVLSNLDISGSADFEVNIPLYENCNLKITGSG